MRKLDWISSLAIALLVSAISVFLGSIQYQNLPIGSIFAGLMIFTATRYIRNTKQSFWQSSLVIVAWGLVTYRAATPTAMGDLILISDNLTWWYIGITGSAALISLIIPSRTVVAKSPDATQSQS